MAGVLAGIGGLLLTHALTGSIRMGAASTQTGLEATYNYRQAEFFEAQAENMRTVADIEFRLGHIALDRHIGGINSLQSRSGTRVWTGTNLYLKQQERFWGNYALLRKLNSDLLRAYNTDVEADYMRVRGDAAGLRREVYRNNLIAGAIFDVGSYATDKGLFDQFQFPSIFPDTPVGSDAVAAVGGSASYLSGKE